MEMEYRPLREEELCSALFSEFQRRQVVRDCWRKIDGKWCVREDPFIDDWSEADYEFLVDCLKNTIRTGGLVLGAFLDGTLKGFASVESEPMGTGGVYRDLTSLHVSNELRGQGVGRVLFTKATDWAKAHGGGKLYISGTRGGDPGVLQRPWAAGRRRNICISTRKRSPLTASWNMR